MSDLTGDTVPRSASSPDGRGDRVARMILVPLAVVFVVVIAIFYGFFSALQVDGPSMLPALHDQDRVLVTHGYAAPARGDIVALRTPIDGQPDDIIKRVIALPGDSVEIRADVAYVNGVREPDRGQRIIPGYAVDDPAQVVPEGMLYVMGDNRAVSLDSRVIGPIEQSGVAGRAVVVFTPVNRIGMVH